MHILLHREHVFTKLEHFMIEIGDGGVQKSSRHICASIATY